MQLKRGCSGAWIAALAAIADQISKAVVRTLGVGRDFGLIAVTPVTNTGAAFSMFSGSTALLTVFSALLIGALAGWLIVRPEGQTKLLRSGLWMIVGGGLGNLYDRIVYGRVTDFIELTFVRFAVFNIADVFICFGAFIVALALLRDERKKELPHA